MVTMAAEVLNDPWSTDRDVLLAVAVFDLHTTSTAIERVTEMPHSDAVDAYSASNPLIAALITQASPSNLNASMALADLYQSPRSDPSAALDALSRDSEVLHALVASPSEPLSRAAMRILANLHAEFPAQAERAC